MRKRFKPRFVALASLSILVSTILVTMILVPVRLLAGEKEKQPPEPVCSLSFVVLKDSDGAPIKNASVVIHALNKDGSQEREGFQLKTATDGRASIDGIPYGRVRVQALAKRLQTYGDDIEVNQPKQEIVIRLKPPAGQLSIYK